MIKGSIYFSCFEESFCDLQTYISLHIYLYSKRTEMSLKFLISNHHGWNERDTFPEFGNFGSLSGHPLLLTKDLHPCKLLVWWSQHLLWCCVAISWLHVCIHAYQSLILSMIQGIDPLLANRTLSFDWNVSFKSHKKACLWHIKC